MKRVFHVALLVVFALLFTGCRDGRPPNAVFSLDDVPDRLIGALYGTPSARLADDLGTALVFNSGNELIAALLAGTVDCAVMESVMAEEITRNASGVRILSDTLLEYELRFAVPRENAELLKVVNAALADLDMNGTLKGLRDKYFSGSTYIYTPPAGITARPGALTLATTPDSPPYSFIDADGMYAGLDIDVAQAVCDLLGVELRVIAVDPGELVTAVWFGRAELAAGWLPGDVDDQVSVTDAYANTAHVIIVRK
ncbi:MAG: transporter substrate-binding domain-containing protein [Oscillospiraceae bacterium]|nr:transporter substrate-binding domain-containing protein [Oscillospiraceae bacterium]